MDNNLVINVTVDTRCMTLSVTRARFLVLSLHSVVLEDGKKCGRRRFRDILFAMTRSVFITAWVCLYLLNLYIISLAYWNASAWASLSASGVYLATSAACVMTVTISLRALSILRAKRQRSGFSFHPSKSRNF